MPSFSRTRVSPYPGVGEEVGIVVGVEDGRGVGAEVKVGSGGFVAVAVGRSVGCRTGASVSAPMGRVVAVGIGSVTGEVGPARFPHHSAKITDRTNNTPIPRRMGFIASFHGVT